MYFDGGHAGGWWSSQCGKFINETTPFKVQDSIFCNRIKQKEHGGTDQRQLAQPAHNS